MFQVKMDLLFLLEACTADGCALYILLVDINKRIFDKDKFTASMN